MNVIKKDGRIDKFNLQKIVDSIFNAAILSKSALNESDIKIFAADIEQTIVKVRGINGDTSSYEIIGIVVDILKKDDFSDVIEKYLSYKK